MISVEVKGFLLCMGTLPFCAGWIPSWILNVIFLLGHLWDEMLQTPTRLRLTDPRFPVILLILLFTLCPDAAVNRFPWFLGFAAGLVGMLDSYARNAPNLVRASLLFLLAIALELLQLYGESAEKNHKLSSSM